MGWKKYTTMYVIYPWYMYIQVYIVGPHARFGAKLLEIGLRYSFLYTALLVEQAGDTPFFLSSTVTPTSRLLLILRTSIKYFELRSSTLQL